MLTPRNAQTTLENVLRDAILYALGKRLPAVASVAALRAAVTAGVSSSYRKSTDLVAIVVDGVVTASYRWSQESSAADDGDLVVKPDDVTANGRWLRWASPLRFTPVEDGDSFYLHELTGGPLEQVLVLDNAKETDEIDGLLLGALPAVIIVAMGDTVEPTDSANARWFVDYTFEVSVLCQNLRELREAAQGSTVTNDAPLGANTIDGLIWELLSGPMFGVCDGIRLLEPTDGRNWISEEGQRRVIRSRKYTLKATVAADAAPNDAGGEPELELQAQMTDLHEQPVINVDWFVVVGITVPVGMGLAKVISPGSAVVGGVAVAYAGGARTFSASVDTYRDLNPDGTLTFVEAGLDASDPPPVTAGALRIGVTRTDGSSVRDDLYIATVKDDYLNPLTISLT
jgi:hypothetical protein